MRKVTAWTDHPFSLLGDREQDLAPVREVEVISYDGDKRCVIRVHGHDGSYFTAEIKSGYIYRRPGRIGKVPGITKEQLASVSMAECEIELPEAVHE